MRAFTALEIERLDTFSEKSTVAERYEVMGCMPTLQRTRQVFFAGLMKIQQISLVVKYRRLMTLLYRMLLKT